ncbi:MAG TPA: sigma-70 family RNA polymerase sigma factor [Actinomycetota bacterium]|nr:sigma-70 family RNA polymerase sigma factor [Actinomycetota bacterium]
MDEPDPAIVAAARGGDLAAFEELVRRYQADVWRFTFHLLHDPSLADDATQDAFVRTFRHIRRFKGTSKFSTWLFSIARNAAIDELRRAHRRDRIEKKIAGERPAGPSGSETSEASDVREAIAALPEELREVIVMVDLLGFAYRDAGAACGIPEGTVKSRVHRARRELLQLMQTDPEAADEL